MTTLEEHFTAANVPMDTNYQEAIEHYPPDVRRVVSDFSAVYKMPIPTKGSKTFKLWIREAREMSSIAGGEDKVLELLKEEYADWCRALHEGKAYTLAGIQSVTGPMRGRVAMQAARGASSVHEDWV